MIFMIIYSLTFISIMATTIVSSSICHHLRLKKIKKPSDWYFVTKRGGKVKTMISMVRESSSPPTPNVLILLGGNDLSDGRHPASIFEDFRILLEVIRTTFDPQNIYVCGLLPRMDLDCRFTPGKGKTAQFNAQLEKFIVRLPPITGVRITYHRVHRAVVGGGKVKLHLYFEKEPRTPIHLNDEGLGKLVDIFVKIITSKQQ